MMCWAQSSVNSRFSANFCQSSYISSTTLIRSSKRSFTVTSSLWKWKQCHMSLTSEGNHIHVTTVALTVCPGVCVRVCVCVCCVCVHDLQSKGSAIFYALDGGKGLCHPGRSPCRWPRLAQGPAITALHAPAVHKRCVCVCEHFML